MQHQDNGAACLFSDGRKACFHWMETSLLMSGNRVSIGRKEIGDWYFEVLF